MTSKTTIRTTLLTLLALALLAAAVGPAWAKKEKREPIEKFRGRAISLDRGTTSTLDIAIYEWTSPEEREALIQTFLDGGSKALYKKLQDTSEKGYVKAPQRIGYDMKYAWQVEVEGKRRIILATDRPMGFVELARNTRSTDYNVSLMVLELDPETGEGEGTAAVGVELSIDKKTNRLNIEFTGTQPTRLVKVKPLPIKKK
ncbi:MAG: hypothetical protein GY719_01635 [bacterium]|nr:hypothetical protein [bacterium]